MALKKPGELFGRKVKEDIPSISVDESFPHIKEEFHKVEDLRKQIDSVSSSLNNSLTEVVDKNLNFLSKEYSEQLNKFNHKIDILKEEIDTKVDSLEKSNQYLKAEIEVVEQRQQTINLNRIKKEVISEVQNLLSGDVSDNIKRLEEKIEVVRGSYQQTLNEGLLNEPPSTKNSDPLTPLDKDYVTLQEFQAQYKIFLNRIQQQMATIGGGGAVNIQDMDDVDLSSAKVNGKYLKYNSSTNKWEGADATGGGGGGVGVGTTNISTSTLNVVGLSTFNDDVQFVGANTNARWDKSKSDLVLYDNTRFTLGDNEDFQMWHGGSNTFMKNTGGDLRIRSNDLRLQKEDGSESYLRGDANAQVTLFYNGNEKLATSNTGVTVTGTVAATAYTGDGSGLTGITGSGSGVVVKHDGSTVGTAGTINFSTNLDVSAISAGIVTVTASAGSGSTANVSTSTLVVAGITTHNQDVQFPGAAYNILWDQATSKFKFDDSAQCVFGSASGGDMKLFHASGNSTIRNETGQFRIAGNDIRLQTQNHSEDYITCTDGADVKLFFNDSEKLATSNTGISVSGTCVATTFSGSGASLTALNASNLSSGTVATARLGSGTASSSTYLRGDGSWQTVSSSGGALDTRGTTSAATGSIAQTASANITIPTKGKSFSLLKVAIDAPAWVVLYVDSASRSSDSSRTEGTDPAPGSGVLTEVSTTTSGASTFLMSPAVLGWNNDSTPAAQVYAKVTNKRSSTGSNAITVTLTTLKLEA